MKVVGVIAEYDPFHLGHKYHIKKAKEMAQADFAVCVISTAFTQRGMPSTFSTYDRAKMALQNGADIVLSLPVTFSPFEGERFAYGGVYILNALRCVTHLCFGAESENLQALKGVSDLLCAPTLCYQNTLKDKLSEGKSFARAQGEALLQHLPNFEEEVFSAPNNALAICYLNALKKLNSPIVPLAVQRVGAYHDIEKTQGFASASAVRNAFYKEDFAFVKENVSEKTYAQIRSILNQKTYMKQYVDTAFLYPLKMQSKESLSKYHLVNEGLENRLYACAEQATNRESLLQSLKTKRYPYARLSRLLCQIFLNIKEYDLTLNPTYTNLLGFNQRAVPLLKALKQAEIPVLSKNAHHKDLLKYDARAEKLWALLAEKEYDYFTQSPIIL